MLNKALIINYPSSENDFRLPIIKYYLKDFYNVDIYINPMWGNYKTKVYLANNPLFIIRYSFKEILYLMKLLIKILKNDYNLIIIGYPAYIEALFLKIIISKKAKKKIYIDFFISIYDTLVLDRKFISPNSLIAKVLYFLDKKLLKSSYQILIDTEKNASRFAEMFKIKINNYKVLFVGSYNLVINRSFRNKRKKNKSIQIGWVGAIIPLHGIEEIIKCALIVKDENIDFHLVGNGPNNELEHVKNEIDSFALSNIKLYNELNFEESMEVLNDCDICLGVFGNSDKAKSVIPFKLFDYLFMNKPIITQHSDALDEISQFKQIYKVDNNACAIAEEIHKIDINEPIDNQEILKMTIRKQYKKVFSIV